MAPSDYRRARDAAAADASASTSSSAASESSPPSSPSPLPSPSSSTPSSSTPTYQVDGRPYLPTLHADPTSPSSVLNVAACVVLGSDAAGDANDVSFVNGDDSNDGVVGGGGGEGKEGGQDGRRWKVSKVTGGITNALFRVQGFRCEDSVSSSSPSTSSSSSSSSAAAASNGGGHDNDHSVLVRIFGAEGMIDRDAETSTYAALCDAGIAHKYLGRFGNGRVEGWLEGYRPLDHRTDLADLDTSDAIAESMARLHGTFRVPDYLREYHDRPGMWDQLHSWLKQARGYDQFQTKADDERAVALNLAQIEAEVDHLEKDVVPPDARVAFCHNDLLAANVMREDGVNGHIQLIDFEYGGMNYVGFDIANHFNEHAGGTDETDNGVPDYGLFPSEDRQRGFVERYVRASRACEEKRAGDAAAAVAEDDIDKEVQHLLKEVHAFVMANHLYWGLWAVNQAAMEGCEEFDYLTYASNRFKQYYLCKAEYE